MKKLIYTLALSLLCGFGASAAPVAQNAKSETVTPKETVKALERLDASSMKLTKINKGKKKLIGTPTAEDFTGVYVWKGNNYLQNIIYPNEGIMTVFTDSVTGNLIVRGFFAGNDLTAYVENGRLYIPNQVVGFSSYYEADMWFWNYTVQKNEYDGNNYITQNNTSYFYFSMDSDGNLQSGNLDPDKWNNQEYTNDELLDVMCFASCIIPDQEGYYYWLCGFIQCNSNKDIYDFSFDINEWDYVGLATFKDCWFPFYWNDVYDAPEYQVPLYVSKNTYGKYLLLDPYGPNTPYGDFNVSNKEGYLIFNISDADFVRFNPVYSMTNDLLGEAYPFYCCNYEGYQNDLLNDSQENIINELYAYGYDVSMFDIDTKTVFIHNPRFLYSDYTSAFYWENYDNLDGYIIFPENSTPETSNPYVPETPFASSSVAPGMVKIFDVLLGSESVVMGLQDNMQIVNDWRIDNENSFLYVWDNTFLPGDSSYPGIGYNDLQFDGYVSFDVNDQGWSGAGFYIGHGVNTSHWNADTRLHVDYRTASVAPSSVAFSIADGDNGSVPAKIAVGDDFIDGESTYPTIAVGPKEEWSSFDISFAELKKLWPDFNFLSSDAWTGNILSVLGGGVSGTNISLDCIYFYTPAEDQVDYYIIGNNVNGKTWELAQPDAKFEEIEPGVYRWSGQILESGFKINDGTWDNYEKNLGASSNSTISMGLPFELMMNGWNIPFDTFTTLIDPVVEFDSNNLTVTLIGGIPEGEVNSQTYYYLSTNNFWIPLADEENGVITYNYDTLPIMDSFRIVKETSYDNGLYNIVYYGANSSNRYIQIGDTKELVAENSGDVSPFTFSNFDVITNPEITIDLNAGTLTLNAGNTYIEKENEDNHGVLYLNCYPYYYLMTYLGNGKYMITLEDTNLEMFYFEYYPKPSEWYAIGTTLEYPTATPGEPLDFILGKNVWQIVLDPSVVNPTVLVDMNTMQLTVNPESSSMKVKCNDNGKTTSPIMVKDRLSSRVINGETVKIVKK